MATTIAAQMLPQGLLIPRAMIQDWGEVEVVKGKHRIVIQPKTLTPGQERELAIQALREDGLLYEPDWEPDLSVISDKERAELAKRLSVGRPLSEIIIEEREDRSLAGLRRDTSRGGA